MGYSDRLSWPDRISIEKEQSRDEMRTEIIQPPNYYKIGIIAWFAILFGIWPGDGSAASSDFQRLKNVCEC